MCVGGSEFGIFILEILLRYLSMKWAMQLDINSPSDHYDAKRW